MRPIDKYMNEIRSKDPISIAISKKFDIPIPKINFIEQVDSSTDKERCEIYKIGKEYIPVYSTDTVNSKGYSTGVASVRVGRKYKSATALFRAIKKKPVRSNYYPEYVTGHQTLKDHLKEKIIKVQYINVLKI